MAAITWRDVVAPQGSGVAGLAQTANQSLNTGLNTLQRVIDQRRTGILDDQNKAESDALNQALSKINALGSVSDTEAALKNNLIGSLGLSSGNAIKAQDALEQRLLETMQLSGSRDAFAQTELIKKEKPILNKLYEAINTGDITLARSLAGKLSNGGQLLSQVNTKEEEITSNKKRQVLDDYVLDKLAQRKDWMNNLEDPLDIEPVLNYVLGDLPSLKGIAGANDLATILSTATSIDSRDPIEQEKRNRDQLIAEQEAINRGLEIKEINDRLSGFAKPNPKLRTVGDVVTDSLISGGVITEEPDRIVQQFARLLDKVGNLDALQLALNEDPAVLRAKSDKDEPVTVNRITGNNLNLDDLLLRAQVHKARLDREAEERKNYHKRLLELGHKPK